MKGKNIMKKTKKFLSLIIAIIMLCIPTTVAFAQDGKNICEVKIVHLNEYNFEIFEMETNDYSSVRTYKNNKRRSLVNYEETKALLNVLGMTEELIDDLSSEALNDYATGEEITVSVSYFKQNEENGISLSVPEDVAIEESALINEQRDKLYESGNAEVQPRGTGYFNDNYLKITHTATRQSGESYKFTVDTQWLVMPIFRGVDSVGICAGKCTVSQLGTGYYTYTIQTTSDGQVYNSSYKGSSFKRNEMDIIDDDWGGCACTFNLPNDSSGTPGITVRYLDYRVHYEYFGKIAHPQLITNFNSIGTYVHSTVSLSVNPGISISTSGNSASIGISIVGKKNTMNALAENRYTP